MNDENKRVLSSSNNKKKTTSNCNSHELQSQFLKASKVKAPRNVLQCNVELLDGTIYSLHLAVSWLNAVNRVLVASTNVEPKPWHMKHQFFYRIIWLFSVRKGHVKNATLVLIYVMYMVKAKKVGYNFFVKSRWRLPWPLDAKKGDKVGCKNVIFSDFDSKGTLSDDVESLSNNSNNYHLIIEKKITNQMDVINQFLLRTLPWAACTTCSAYTIVLHVAWVCMWKAHTVHVGVFIISTPFRARFDERTNEGTKLIMTWHDSNSCSVFGWSLFCTHTHEHNVKWGGKWCGGSQFWRQIGHDRLSIDKDEGAKPSRDFDWLFPL